ncbi:hypothetical protein G9U51_11030 [Calidifontibacter sp. DB0510]|uniref:Uncharacterized protein n=1 Tax=Metallococcus carri TaxID=1656884 RepID=A0A967B037_9MICO|nr:hypothetical protein [Metallococcus carri]NHN56309.1 hypothetical protein [Metallococcus carri]NOP38639.1 hypothetical protein [Calidifontibacter sp. DB2511S]
MSPRPTLTLHGIILRMLVLSLAIVGVLCLIAALLSGVIYVTRSDSAMLTLAIVLVVGALLCGGGAWFGKRRFLTGDDWYR